MFLHPTGKFDNSSRAYRHIEARPLAAAMGAEILGVSIGSETAAQFAEIEDALFRHKMIYFRGQHIGHAEHHAFSRRFGEFAEDAYTDGMPGFREVQPLIKEADDNSEHIFGSGWHTDSPFLPEPPSITMLRSVQIPPYGGDTMWTNSALAYSMLSDSMQTLVAGLKVHFSLRDVLASAQAHAEQRDSPVGRLVGMKDLSPAVLTKVRGNMHPLVRTHARSGEKALYIDPSYAIGLEGFREDEAAPLLKYLNDHLTQVAFTCRLRWETGMLALWDNRLCLHQAFNDYQGHRREMYRTTIAGEVPR